MDSNEKKGKRPRIGARPYPVDSQESGRDTTNSTGDFTGDGVTTDTHSSASQYSSDRQPYGERQQRPYQPRPYGAGSYNRQGGYQNNRYGHQNSYQQGNNRYGNQGGYQQRGYQPRPQVPHTEGQPTEGVESTESTSSTEQTTGYQPRNNYNNRQQGGYQPRNNYNNRQGGYQPRQQGGYQPRQQGGYQPRQQQGGYQQRQQGGYQNKGPRQNQYGMPQGGRSFTPRPKRIEYETPIPDPNEQVRLNKFMANAGLCSRREADEYILKGLIKVNGEVVTELGTKINHSDIVEYDGKVVTLEKKCYILLNKPKDCVTTSDDPNGRLTVLDLIKGACEERVYPVGRLDRNTTGVLLLTNDGDLASKLTHPKYVKKKIYHVWTDHDISEDDMQRIAD
ncbi:MAG: RNA-binding S4 domain-containing protein, partial [Duncaniella sp.]|nr:RNA-binding S4 domain-containing protein [Duncaniella sp.]